MKHNRARPSDRRDLKIQLGLDRRVLSYITNELGKNPNVEEGGKYVGYLLPASDSRLRDYGFDPSAQVMVITDFLPSGPNATRSAVELQPDGEYQERLFRQVEKMDREIEHVGTWHSHHCNGLQTLSSGDLVGYLRTVNRAEYRLDYFLASLVTRLPQGASDQGWIDHYLFVRGDEEYYKINHMIKFIDWRTVFGRITGHSIDIGARPVRLPAEKDTTSVANLTSDVWYEMAQNRKILADDKRFFTERFNGAVTATRRGKSITLIGRTGPVTISMTYPSEPGTSQVTVSVRRDDVVTLEISSELKWRRLAMTAALAAAADII
jgi:hypothetical protein